MKVAIDTAPLKNANKIRGMGFYVRNLIEELRDRVDAFEFSSNQEKLHQYDVLHYPYFDLFYNTLSGRRATKTVITVPDVTPLIYPQRYPMGLKGKINFMKQKRALQSVESIITLSETSKKDIVRLLGISASKIYPIYLAPGNKHHKADDKAVNKIKKKYKLPDKFVLYIGDVNYNKNIIRLFKACRKSRVVLVMVGKQALSADYDKNHIENRSLKLLQNKYGDSKWLRRLGYLESEELAAVWQLASVYCQPSLYEGFGLPVLEAFQAGVPVVAAKTQALVEVAGNAATYVDPKDIDSISKGLLRVLTSQEKTIQLIAKGNERLKDFSWEKTADETIKIYSKLT